jgi:spermidine synthase
MNNRRTGSPMLIFLALGFTAQLALLVLARELQTAFQGSELSIAALFMAQGFWTAVGAFLALRDDRSHLVPGADGMMQRQVRARDGFALAAVVLSLALPMELLGVRLLRTLCGLTADSPAPLLELLVVALILLAPVGLCLGSQFVYAAQAVQSPTRVYIGEASGGALAGFLLSLFLAPTVNSFASAYFATSVSLLAAAWFLRPTGQADPVDPAQNEAFRGPPMGVIRSKLFAPLLTLAVLSIVCLLRSPDTDAMTRETFWKAYAPSFTLVASEDSPQGHLAILTQAGVSSVYHSGQRIGQLPIESRLSPVCRTLLSLCPRPRRVLLIDDFAGAGGLLAGILQEGARQVDVIDIDPKLASLVQTHAVPDRARARYHPRVTLFEEDARAFLHSSNRKYEVVILRIGDAETLHSSRFLTVEFFAEVRNSLVPGGLLCLIQTPAIPNANLPQSWPGDRVSVLQTVAHLFGDVRTFPGESPFLLASNRSLPVNTGPQAHVPDSEVNTDARPICFNRALFLENAEGGLRMGIPGTRIRFGTRTCGLAVGILLLAASIPLLRLPRTAAPVAAAVLATFATGFSGMTALVLTIFSFQTTLGTLYERLGWIVACYLTGTAIGAVWEPRVPRSGWKRTPLASQQFLFSAFLLALPHMLRVPEVLPTPLMQMLFFGLAILLAGIFVGGCYPLAIHAASSEQSDRSGVGITAIGNIGSSLGASLIAICVVPRFGLTASGTGCAILLLASALLAWLALRSGQGRT